MKRTSGLAVFVVCLVILIGTAATTAASIGLGAWQPAGERPAPTARPDVPEPGFPEPPPEDYAGFLEQVQAGEVLHVDFTDGMLSVSTSNSGYQVELPPGVDDPYPDIVNAATLGGVQPPPYTVDGQQENLGERTYEEMLADVEAGRLVDVAQYGTDLTCSMGSGFYLVVIDDASADVLGDIEAAAEAGGVAPPGYSKYPIDR